MGINDLMWISSQWKRNWNRPNVPYTIIPCLPQSLCRLRAIELTEYYLKAFDCDLQELFEIMKSEDPAVWNETELKLEQYIERD